MLKLFACYLWWKVEWCQIEIHDVQFSVGESIEDCYDDLEKKWLWYPIHKCHIDAFLELKYIDGYEVVLTTDKPDNWDNILYFVNAWGYIPEKFGEMHEIWFYVTKSNIEATQKALAILCEWQDKRHQDNIYDVDDILEIEKVREYYIKLIPTNKIQDFQPMYFWYWLMTSKLSEKIVHQNY